MNDLSLRKKLLLSFGSLLIVIAVLGGYANFSLHKVSEKTGDITGRGFQASHQAIE